VWLYSLHKLRIFKGMSSWNQRWRISCILAQWIAVLFSLTFLNLLRMNELLSHLSISKTDILYSNSTRERQLLTVKNALSAYQLLLQTVWSTALHAGGSCRLCCVIILPRILLICQFVPTPLINPYLTNVENRLSS